MRRMMIAATACVLVAGLVVNAEDPKPAQPAQPVPKAAQPVPKAVQPIQPLPGRVVTVTAAKMAQLEEEFETVEAHHNVKKAHVKAAEVAVEATKVRYELDSKVAAGGREAQISKFEFEMAKAQLDIRIAELKESEVKVKHAKKRLDDAKLGGVRPVPGIGRPVPIDPKQVDPIPQVRFVADEKEIAELKVKLAKALVASDKAAADVKRTEELVKLAEVELARIKDVARLGRIAAGTIEKAEAKVKEAKDAQEKAAKERKVLEEEVAALQKKLEELKK